MRSGTTSLFNYILDNSQVQMPFCKETHFFDKGYAKGLEFYENLFKKYENKDIITGEATPSYMYMQEVPERIKTHIPNAKLIFILREPVSRANSHYWHNIRFGIETYSFKKALQKEEERLAKKDLKSRMRYSYKDRGKYIVQLKRYQKYFPEKQMLVLLYDDLKQNPDKVMEKIFNFLELKPRYPVFKYKKQFHVGKTPLSHSIQRMRGKIPYQSKNPYYKQIDPLRFIIDLINLKPGYPPINQKTQKELKAYFKPYNEELESYLKIKLENW